MQSLAIYVHFPFCLSICPYCDFDRQATGFDRIDTYLAEVEREIRSYGGEGRAVHSVFFGGGTPSLMQPVQVDSVLRTIREVFDVEADAEVTLETNPGDADPRKFGGFTDAGVNRVSMGVQSLDDAFLALLGRRHSAAEAAEAAGWAKSAGLKLNLDFMYGLPDQTLEHWAGTLDQAVQLDTDHLSCYLLTVDEHVPLGRDVARGRLVLPEDDALADLYDHARTRLAECGYEQYEISNWAKPGQASRHNLTYWRDGTWLGVGAGAASSHAGRRWKNTPSLERYITSMRVHGRADRQEDEAPDLATRVLDCLTLGLRLREGVSVDAFRQRFGVDWRDVAGEEAGWLCNSGVLRVANGRLTIAAERQLVTNEVLVRLRDPIHAWANRQESLAAAR